MSRQEKWIRRTLEKDKMENTPQEEVGRVCQPQRRSGAYEGKGGALERKSLKWQCSSESQGQRLGAPERILSRAVSSLSYTCCAQSLVKPSSGKCDVSMHTAADLRYRSWGLQLNSPYSSRFSSEERSGCHTPMAATRTDQKVPQVALGHII